MTPVAMTGERESLIQALGRRWAVEARAAGRDIEAAALERHYDDLADDPDVEAAEHRLAAVQRLREEPEDPAPSTLTGRRS